VECGKETVERSCGTVGKMRNAEVAKIRTLCSKLTVECVGLGLPLSTDRLSNLVNIPT